MNSIAFIELRYGLINEIEIRADGARIDCNRNVTVTNLGTSSAPARDKSFHGVINAIFSRNTGHTRLRNKSGSIEMAHPPAGGPSFSFFLPRPPSLGYMLTKHFQPRDQFHNRMANSCLFDAYSEPDKSKKCFVKRQEFVVINESGRKKERSTVRSSGCNRAAKDETTSMQTWNSRINTRD